MSSENSFSSDKVSEDETTEILNNVEYFKPDQTQLIYNFRIYNYVKENKNKTKRWRCSICNQCGIATKDDQVIKHPTKKAMHKPTCYQITKLELDVLKQYEKLKFKSHDPNFEFLKEYNQSLAELQATRDIDHVSKYWPSELKARNTINTIRYKNKMCY